MNSVSAIALSGMNAAQSSLWVSAHNIANLGTAGFRRQQQLQSEALPRGVETTGVRSEPVAESIDTDVVNQLQAKNSFLSDLAVFRTGDRMVGALLYIAS